MLRCDYFIGLVGERYGWTPDTYDLPQRREYEWIRHQPVGRSVTDLEMSVAIDTKPKQKLFFFLRDAKFMKLVFTFILYRCYHSDWPISLRDELVALHPNYTLSYLNFNVFILDIRGCLTEM